MNIAKGISIQVDNTWKDFDSPCPSGMRAGCQVIVTCNDKVCGAHHCIDFALQSKADKAASMRVIAMKDSIIVINNEWDTQPRQNAFGEGWQPGEKFFFDPEQIKGTRPQYVRQTPEISGCNWTGVYPLPSIKSANIFIAEERKRKNLDSLPLQKWEILEKTHPAARAEAIVTS
jgi:hypothetical protein